MTILPRWLHRTDKLQADEIRRLAESEDVSAVGSLVDALSVRDEKLLSLVEAALIRLLPQLTPEQTHLLDAKQRKRLNQALSGKNRELTLAILAAWEQVGNYAAAWDVLCLRNRTVDLQIRAASDECYRILNERAAKGPELLVRASAPPCAPAQTSKRDVE